MKRHSSDGGASSVPSRSKNAPIFEIEFIAQPASRPECAIFLGREIPAALPDDRNGAHDAENHGCGDQSLSGAGEPSARGGINPCSGHMPQRKQHAEVAEADALQDGVRGAACARSHQAAPPPGFEHRVAAEAATARCARRGRGESPSACRARKTAPAPTARSSPLTAKNVKKRFSTTRSPRISSCAPSGVAKSARAREIAVDAVERDGGDGEQQRGGEIGSGRSPANVNSATAANAAATRAAVTWFGVMALTFAEGITGPQPPAANFFAVPGSSERARDEDKGIGGPTRDSRSRQSFSAGLRSGARARRFGATAIQLHLADSSLRSAHRTKSEGRASKGCGKIQD